MKFFAILVITIICRL